MELPEGYSPDDVAKIEFYYPKRESGKTGVGARVMFHDVELMVIWEDTQEGEQHFLRLLGSLPGIVNAAKQERNIKEEARSLDTELADFFGDDE